MRKIKKFNSFLASGSANDIPFGKKFSKMQTKKRKIREKDNWNVGILIQPNQWKFFIEIICDLCREWNDGRISFLVVLPLHFCALKYRWFEQGENCIWHDSFTLVIPYFTIKSIKIKMFDDKKIYTQFNCISNAHSISKLCSFRLPPFPNVFGGKNLENS